MWFDEQRAAECERFNGLVFSIPQGDKAGRRFRLFTPRPWVRNGAVFHTVKLRDDSEFHPFWIEVPLGGMLTDHYFQACVAWPMLGVAADEFVPQIDVCVQIFPG